MLYTGTVGMSVGYLAILGDKLDAVTDSLAKSFMGTFDLQSIRISELKEDILYLERKVLGALMNPPLCINR